ncbi:hypothetical protein J6590_051632 [Homalodisca vitripennis]|nr:hypothetical protein J6590_051632 [Homalodisca vitripennis]
MAVAAGQEWPETAGVRDRWSGEVIGWRGAREDPLLDETLTSTFVSSDCWPHRLDWAARGGVHPYITPRTGTASLRIVPRSEAIHLQTRLSQ